MLHSTGSVQHNVYNGYTVSGVAESSHSIAVLDWCTHLQLRSQLLPPPPPPQQHAKHSLQTQFDSELDRVYRNLDNQIVDKH